MKLVAMTCCACTQSLDWQIHCLDVRPERQHECAVGSSGGAVSLWDLRFIGQPILCTANPDHGNVREVGPPDESS